MQKNKTCLLISILLITIIFACTNNSQNKNAPEQISKPKARLIESEKFYFNSFVDCNMAEAWVGDTFRIFPGKYGEDPMHQRGANCTFRS